jgi:CO dehydrogenase nickel-insertion accessory protein CooC1
MDITLIVTKPNKESAELAGRIEEYSSKYAADGQMGIVLNCVDNNKSELIYSLREEYNLSVIGIIPIDNELINGDKNKDSEIVQNAIKQFYYRLNIPRGDLS